MKYPLIGGKHYLSYSLMTSQGIKVILCMNKLEALENFEMFHAEVETVVDNKIGSIQSDIRDIL